MAVALICLIMSSKQVNYQSLANVRVVLWLKYNPAVYLDPSPPLVSYQYLCTNHLTPQLLSWLPPSVLPSKIFAAHLISLHPVHIVNALKLGVNVILI